MIEPIDPWDIACWVIYDHPQDYPLEYVARLWMIEQAGPRPTTEVMVSRNLGDIERALEVRGFTRTTVPEDDPTIVGTWL